ncbi:unnamed protein product [Hermetia illucens]|uniref:tRNA (guanine(10)-N(2))-methyltransferase TRMT11 n=1 Tax=Hermetia illucens TaxID=343691 RepID=A0A7R8YVE2_HERIL|nr:tRNA (guanine(10)-N2)-methyltransferase homolog [Hermetia illucens]CAD7083729.1 unnamed protein product [Hermetia illucens]
MTKSWMRFLFWFAQEHVDFRHAEIESLTQLFGIKWNLQPLVHKEQPFWIVELPDENSARIIASRSISLRCIIHLWSHASSVTNLHENTRNYIKENFNDVNHFFSPDKSFKITVETYNKHFSQKEKIEKIETFDYLPFRGEVELKTPDVEWWYIEYYGLNPRDVPPQPFDVLFGRWIVDGQRNLIKEMSLKKRKFIGNTSMDTQLSLLMANQAKVKQGDFVFDPFVGTGSLLVSAAKFGGFVIGADIDYMMIHAKSRPSRITQKQREKDESIRANLEQYNCADRYVDVIVSDFSNPIWNDRIRFDSIITDPPYGIREATAKIETKISQKPDTRTEDSPHYPSTSHYSLANLYADLLTFAAKHLTMNGRLVCWLPIHNDDYTEDQIPKHPCLKLIANSNQPLSAATARRLLTYEKVFEVDERSSDESAVILGDFRQRYFEFGEETRKERRMRRAELREIGRQEALKRGKTIDENGKVIKNK